jgi:hypothetical protein
MILAYRTVEIVPPRVYTDLSVGTVDIEHQR